MVHNQPDAPPENIALPVPADEPVEFIPMDAAERDDIPADFAHEQP